MAAIKSAMLPRSFRVLIGSADDCPIATTQDLALPRAGKT
jgi:hypothetical protein